MITLLDRLYLADVFAYVSRRLPLALHWLDVAAGTLPIGDPNRYSLHYRRAECLGVMGRAIARNPSERDWLEKSRKRFRRGRSPYNQPMPSVLPRLFERGADPWVLRHADGFVYYLGSAGGNRLELRRATTLAGLADAPPTTIWTPPAGTAYSRELWAPELHFLHGAWWIYVAADDGDNANHKMWALTNPGPDPMVGDWSLHGPLATVKWAIDGTVLEEDGRLYFIWSGWEGDENVAQDLYIAPMSDPATLSGPRVRISTPDRPWEMRGSGGPGKLPAINEGPQVLVRGDSVHIVYSASGSWSDFYCLGRLTRRRGADPLDPGSWTKHPGPVFESANGIVAPGHCSFLTGEPDGDWIVYHAARHPGAGWDRFVRAQTFTWSGDDPDFGQPAP